MNETFAEKLALLRAQKGLTQRELGAAAGVAWSMISKYESGQSMPRLKVLIRLAEALGVTTEELQTAPAKNVIRIYDGFSSRLVELRSSRGMSRTRLAERSGIEADVIEKLELGEILPLEEDVIALSTALDSPVSVLAGSADEPEVVVLRLTEEGRSEPESEFARVPLPPSLYEAFENAAKDRGLTVGTYLGALVRLDLARYERPEANVTLEDVLEEMNLEKQ